MKKSANNEIKKKIFFCVTLY